MEKNFLYCGFFSSFYCSFLIQYSLLITEHGVTVFLTTYRYIYLNFSIILLKGNYIVNKSELISAIAEKSSLTKADSGRALDATIEAITESLTNGEPVTLIGFGTFEVRDRAARSGRNPRTGETIQIKASKNPAFKAGKALKDAVN